MIRIPVGEASEVLVGEGLPDRVLPNRADRERAAVLVQPGARYLVDEVLRRIEEETAVFELPDREEAKRLSEVGRIYEALASAGIGRHDTVVGVGGGAATDMAGFVASTWLRGVEAVLVPTTLLGAVDAAVGGKTGLNLEAGKNLVGTFSHPSRVVVDLAVLRELPSAIQLEGHAEILKAGLIGAEGIYHAYRERGSEVDLALVVPAAIRLKAEVVAGDFRESAGRAILNFGHTIGHAVELLAPMPHGHAVAVGMVAALEISHRRWGLDPAPIRGLIERIGLPVASPGVSIEAAHRLIANDKKRSVSGVRMVLLPEVGRPVVEPVTGDELELGLLSIGAVR